MPNQVNLAEEIVKEINQSVFFKEFTFTNNKLGGKDNDELADSIVWLDDIFLLIQIKLRDTASQGTAEQEKKWFENKVILKAKVQIKSSLSYFEKYDTLLIPNGRGFEVDLKAAPVAFSKRLILYYPGANLADEERFRKFYVSREVGLFHFFHLEDYQWICRYLFTPFEINDYLITREELFTRYGNALNEVPEQLLLGFYLSGDDIEDFNLGHIEYLHRFSNSLDEFDISGIIIDFFERQQASELSSDKYHYVVKELAKMHRSDLKQFKQRFLRALEMMSKREYVLPYRIVVPNTGCGFVFIPVPTEQSANWETALRNFTFAHKYDQHLDKCIGIVFSNASGSPKYIDINWLMIVGPWQKDEAYEQQLYAKFPLREVRVEEADRYKFD